MTQMERWLQVRTTTRNRQTHLVTDALLELKHFFAFTESGKVPQQPLIHCIRDKILERQAALDEDQMLHEAVAQLKADNATGASGEDNAILMECFPDVLEVNDEDDGEVIAVEEV